MIDTNQQFLPKPNLIEKIQAHLRTHWRQLLFLSLAAGAGVLMFYTLFLQRIFYDRPGRTYNLVHREDTTKKSPLTGLRVPIPLADRPVSGIMIENSPDSRPQSSVSQAGVVFEAVAEGGITRYIVFYQEAQPQVIGPVRSLRPYYLDWAMGFDANVAHAGGSADAMALIGERGAKSMNGLVYSQGYWRTGDRVAPHNMYTSAERQDALAKELGYFNPPSFTPLPRTRKEKPAATPTHTTISMDFSGPIYAAEFRYDAASNNYLRFLAGAPDVDRENNQQVAVKNLVLIPMPTTYSGSYAIMNSLGSGDTVVFRDGIAIAGTWSKGSHTEQIKLKDAEGKPIPLNAGSTWFAVVPAGRHISY